MNYQADFRFPRMFLEEDGRQIGSRQTWYGFGKDRPLFDESTRYTIVRGGKLYFAAEVSDIHGLVTTETDTDIEPDKADRIKQIVLSDLTPAADSVRKIYDFIQAYRAANHPHLGHLPHVWWEKTSSGPPIFKVADGFSGYWGWPGALWLLKEPDFAEYEEDIIGAYKRHLDVSRRKAKKRLKRLSALAERVEARKTVINKREDHQIFVLAPSLAEGIEMTEQLRINQDVNEFSALYAEVKAEVRGHSQALFGLPF